MKGMFTKLSFIFDRNYNFCILFENGYWYFQHDDNLNSHSFFFFFFFFFFFELFNKIIMSVLGIWLSIYVQLS